MDYADFIKSKRVSARSAGFEPTLDLNPHLKDFQKDVVLWAIRRGRAATWLERGLGKTLVQLEWARHVCHYTGGNVLILTPLAVAKQTVREGQKFGIPVMLARSQAGVRSGINVTNYQMLKHFSPSSFQGIVCDESQILNNFTGVTKRQVFDFSAWIKYKLDCSATPRTNDHLELGNHADFLGVMASNEMISRWFINDSMNAGKYRLKGHAADDFWRWISSWAVAMGKPSDLGYSDEGYDLPPLSIHEHVVSVDLTMDREDGELFRDPEMSATSMHKEMRRTAPDRARKVREIVYDAWDRKSQGVIWVNTDYDAEEIKKLIPDLTEIKGPDPVERKESKVEAFTNGEILRLMTKPPICGYGLNWQNCHQTLAAGLTYSWASLYQLIGRFHRFGQGDPVRFDVITAETETRLSETIARKQREFDEMKREMIRAVLSHGIKAEVGSRMLSGYDPQVPMIVPEWIKGGAA